MRTRFSDDPDAVVVADIEICWVAVAAAVVVTWAEPVVSVEAWGLWFPSVLLVAAGAAVAFALNHAMGGFRALV